MKFNELLDTLKMRNKFSKMSELYTFLGGKKVLGIDLRAFYLIASGRSAPSVKVFLAIFNQLPPEDYKSALSSFFTSASPGKASQKLRDHLDEALYINYSTQAPNIWNTTQSAHRFLSESQLTFLNNNPEALRFFNRLLIYDRIGPAEAAKRHQLSAQLIEQDLAIREPDGGLRIIAPIVMTPSFDNSPKPTARLGQRYILKHIEAFYEGSPDTENLSYVIQAVPQSKHRLVLEQSNAFKKWIQRQAVPVDSEGAVPLLYIGFTKQLSPNDF